MWSSFSQSLFYWRGDLGKKYISIFKSSRLKLSIFFELKRQLLVESLLLYFRLNFCFLLILCKTSFQNLSLSCKFHWPTFILFLFIVTVGERYCEKKMTFCYLSARVSTSCNRDVDFSPHWKQELRALTF